jgi:putative endonuclease
MSWTVYMLECADTSLYTGITVDLERRLEEHSKGKGAKYTKHRGPFTVVFTEFKETMGQALKREAEIKSMKREEKLGLIGTR